MGRGYGGRGNSQSDQVLRQLTSLLANTGGAGGAGKGGGKGRKGGGKGAKSDDWRDPNVLAGPRLPHWGCGCGESNNWACRIRCKCCERWAPQTTQNAARAAAKQAEGGGKQGGQSKQQGPATPPWAAGASKAVSPDTTFADLTKRLATMGCDQAIIGQLKPKEEEPEKPAVRVKLEPPADLQAALRARTRLQQQQGSAAKDIEKSEKIIKDQQQILDKRKAKMVELDEQLAEVQADVAKFETLDVTGAAGSLGQIGMAMRMLNEVKADKKLEGLLANFTHIEKILEETKMLAEAAVAAAPEPAPDDSAQSAGEGGDGMDITGDELDAEALARVCAAAGMPEPTEDQKRKVSEQLGAEARAKKQRK